MLATRHAAPVGSWIDVQDRPVFAGNGVRPIAERCNIASHIGVKRPAFPGAVTKLCNASFYFGVAPARGARLKKTISDSPLSQPLGSFAQPMLKIEGRGAEQEDTMARKNHAVDRHLGARVRFARIEKRISQGALGEQLGISFQQVQKYELGKDRISASQLMNIARILDKDISFFFEDIASDGDASGGIELADIVDRRKRSRASATYDVKIIRILHAIDDERLKLKLYNLMEAIVAAKVPADAASGASALVQ